MNTLTPQLQTIIPKLSFKIPTAKRQFKHWRASWVCQPKWLHQELRRLPGGFGRGPTAARDGVVRRTDVKRACLPEQYCWPAWQCSRVYSTEMKQASVFVNFVILHIYLHLLPNVSWQQKQEIKHRFKESQLRRDTSNWGRLLKREPLHLLRSKTNLKTRCIFVMACWH